MISINTRSYRDHLNRVIAGGMPIANQADEAIYITSFKLFHGTILNDSVSVQLVAGTPAQLIVSGVENGWAGLGISAGDTIAVSLEAIDGSSTVSGNFAVNIVDGDTLTSSGFPISINSSEGFVYVNKSPQAFEANINLVPSDGGDNLNSIIDNTTIRLINENISTLGVGSGVSLTQIGNRSGGIIRNATLGRKPDSFTSQGILVREYELAIRFVWWGYLSVFGEDYFQDASCITPIVKATFFPVFNDHATQLSTTFKPLTDGNSGFRNENFNQNPNPFNVQTFTWKDENDNPIGAFDYSQNCKFEAEISSTIGFGTNFGLIFFNDIGDTDLITATTENTIGNYGHDQLTLLGEKADLTATTGQSLTSALGINGEQYTISGIEISTTGTIATVKGQFFPNQAFTDKFSDENNTEKDFAFLFRCEGTSLPATNYSKTVNNLIWKGTGDVSPIILGEYPMTSSIFDHARNSDKVPPFKLIIEDDIRLVSNMNFDLNRVYKRIGLGVVAKNSVTGEWFWLEESSFSLDETILQDGSQNINTTAPTYFASVFPPTALNNRFIIGKGSVGVSDYEVTLSNPTLIRWEYWQQQLNTALQFYGNATKDWRQYRVGDWDVQFLTEIEVDEGTYQNFFNYDFEDYDHNAKITSTFEFERLDATPITTPLVGEVIVVRAKFVDNDGDPILKDWGMITVEPYEGNTRPVISDYYPQGSQPSNPLQPTVLGVDRLYSTGWGTDTVIMECLFDPNQINIVNGVSFTARINAQSKLQAERHKESFPVVQLPVDPNDQGKGDRCCDCLPELKLGSTTSNELIKNDIIGHAHKIMQPDQGEYCEWKIYKDGVLLPNLGVEYASFPNDPNVSAFVYNVRNYIIEYGQGCYEVFKKINPAGLEFELSVGKYEFKEFTTENAEGTTRALVQFNMASLYEHNGQIEQINYAGSGFMDSFRFRGMFHGYQPNDEVVNHYSDNRQNRTATIVSKGSYILDMYDATDCQRWRLDRLAILASKWQMSDHNWTNPDQRMIITNCVRENGSSLTFNYFTDNGSRKLGATLSLTRENENNVSRFGGTNQLPLGVTSVLQTIGASTVVDPNNCSPALVTVVNSDGATVGSATIPSGGNASVPAPDGTIEITNQLNVVIQTLTVPSNGTIQYQNFYGGNGIAEIYDSAMNLLYTVPVAPDGVNQEIIMDSQIIVRNSANTLLTSLFIPAEDTYTYTVPDATVNFETTGGIPAGTQNVPSGESTLVIIPDGPPSAISVDGVYKGDLPSGDPLNILIEDQDSNPITPISGTVSSGVATIVLPDETYNIYVNGVLNTTFTAQAMEDLTINITA